MPIDTSQASKDWQSGAKAKVDKLVRNYTAKTGKVAAATSPEAQKAYVDGVTDPVSQKLRTYSGFNLRRRILWLSGETSFDNFLQPIRYIETMLRYKFRPMLWLAHALVQR